MKTIKHILTVIALGTTISVGAQTTTNTFFNSFEAYFTSFDTNSTTFQNCKLEVWTGVDQSENDLSAIFGLQYDINTNWFAETIIRNADIGGTVVGTTLGGGYSIVHYDTKVEFGLDAGYRFDQGVPIVSPFIGVRKALTANTFAGMRLYYEQPLEKTGGNFNGTHAPSVSIETGFTF